MCGGDGFQLALRWCDSLKIVVVVDAAILVACKNRDPHLAKSSVPQSVFCVAGSDVSRLISIVPLVCPSPPIELRYDVGYAFRD